MSQLEMPVAEGCCLVTDSQLSEFKSFQAILEQLEIKNSAPPECCREEDSQMRIICWDKPQAEIEALLESIHVH
jgi:hypothetical protein